ncbi:hypothetical protein PSA5_04630 [Pseudomonas syringae pv. actinidiae]|nr:hypothetical protein PSA5_04630 [Pseudomonas syringae pv. actinidiae]
MIGYREPGHNRAAVATGENQFHDPVAKLGGETGHFCADQHLIDCNRQALATAFKTLQVTLKKQWLTGLDGDGFKHSVTVRHPPVLDRQGVCAAAINPGEHYSANRRNTSEPLVPPNPKEFDRTTSIGIRRAS